MRKKRISNREEILKYRRDWYGKNVVQQRAYQKEQRDKNKEKRLARRRELYSLNPEKPRERSRNFRNAHKDICDKRRDEWRKNNPLRVRELRRKSYHKNITHIADYRVKHQEHIKKVKKEWVNNNRIHVREKNRNRRALRGGSIGSHTYEQFINMCELKNWKCFYCGKTVTIDNVTEDHMIPISRGGSDYMFNIAPCCKHCNSSKHNKTPNEFMEYTLKLKGEENCVRAA